jgi:hypothetical protein
MPEEVGRMRSACRRRAARYDWDRFVARIDDVMEEVATTGAVTAPMHRIEPDRSDLAELARLESRLDAVAARDAAGTASGVNTVPGISSLLR